MLHEASQRAHDAMIMLLKRRSDVTVIFRDKSKEQVRRLTHKSPTTLMRCVCVDCGGLGLAWVKLPGSVQYRNIARVVCIIVV